LTMQAWIAGLRDITFAQPKYLELVYVLYAVWIGLALNLIYKRMRRPERSRDAKFRLIGRDSLWIFTSLLIANLIISLAGPQIKGFKVISSSGNLDIIFAFDESFSMAASDILPSRHDVAVRTINDLLGSQGIHPGDRLTLFVFGGESKWRMPLSDDLSEFRDQLSLIEHPKDKKYMDGSQLFTNIESALEHIPEALAKQDKYYKSLPSNIVNWTPNQRVVLLFTDGDDASSFETASRIYKKNKMPVYVVALGTIAGAMVRVKVADDNDPEKFDSLNIRTKVQVQTLKKIAAGGERGIFLMNSGNKSAASFLNANLAGHRNDLPQLVKKDDPDKFWWPVLACSLLFIFLAVIFY